MPELNISQNIERPIVNPETGFDSGWEQKNEQLNTVNEEHISPVVPVFQTVPSNQSNNQSVYKDARLTEIENILEQDLEEIYFNLPDEAKQIFKVEGEETARKINSLLGETKVAVQKIIDLIVDWLSVLPGVNKFFIEQEAKIKTDKIMIMK